MKNFNRQYRVRIGPNDATGKEIGAPDLKTGRPLHCVFSVELGDSESANTGKIELHNLSPDTIHLLEQPDCIIELRAGYGDDRPTIMGGYLSHMTTSMDGADTRTSIEIIDGLKRTRDSYISVSYAGTVDGRQIVQDAVAKIGCGLRCSAGAAFASMTNFAYVGQATGLIRKVCGAAGLRWSIQNGVLQICSTKEPITSAAYLISADTGLIGYPEEVFESSSSSDASGKNTTNRKSQSGWKIRYLLNGHIQIDDLVHIESKRVQGDFRVKKISISGDSEGGDWFCAAEVVEV